MISSNRPDIQRSDCEYPYNRRMELDQRQRTREIDRRLRATRGERVWSSDGDGLGGLISTILSQNTSDVNSRRAFASLTRTFPTWEAVLTVPAADVAEAIRSGGLANIKAPRIQSTVRYVLDHFPDGDLSGLTTLSLDEARRALTAIPGVGMKTASCVLLFNLGMPAMPVDTHVHRVASRTGMIPARTSADAAHAILEGQLDGSLGSAYTFHLNCIAHGREICLARGPACHICPIQDLCRYFAGLPT